MALRFCPTATFHPQREVNDTWRVTNCLDSVRNLVQTLKIPSIVRSPRESLRNGTWVKLICGASFEDVADIRNLSLVYTLAGVDCIDCAADESVIRAVKEGIQRARDVVPLRRPWIMISVNDDEDLHFRKAEFDPSDCPSDCRRPCETVCPANAISFKDEHAQNGVITDRCYGCGRCIPVCPYDKIGAVNYIRDSKTVANLLAGDDVDALEIHTSGSQIGKFEELWEELGDSIEALKVVAISLPYFGESTVRSMGGMYSIMKRRLKGENLWQLDGRPMSGDIGRGAGKEMIAFAGHMAEAKDRPPGFYHVAGGSNERTADGLRREGLFRNSEIGEGIVGGVGFGGYARKVVGRVLDSMKSDSAAFSVEDEPVYLLQALREALRLVGTVKPY